MRKEVGAQEQVSGRGTHVRQRTKSLSRASRRDEAVRHKRRLPKAYADTCTYAADAPTCTYAVDVHTCLYAADAQTCWQELKSKYL